jgi:DNA-binding NtrC family response regulator
VRTTAFSPAARLALDELEKLARTDETLGLLTPPGVDAQGFAAHAHLLSRRANGPFVTIDGTEREARKVEAWRDPERSPLVAADGGTLLILNAPALPREVQEHLAQFLVQRAHAEPASGVVPVGLILGLPTEAEALRQGDRLHEALARAVTERELWLPRLAERAEDLRALVLEALSRFGVAATGDPLGIEPAAMAALGEHEFPGNELELYGLLSRTAVDARGYRITLADVTKGGLAKTEPIATSTDPDDEHSPPPTLAVRRRALRRAR